ncbi:hypothetical protein VNO78_11729 [Psophocarpus tetragonolobus]|uniref:Secreted protein n=1 Tax=Psophocarpus tetragonolobus TaxID=3891 RepID=A0AAN9SLZ6_PSOTE
MLVSAVCFLSTLFWSRLQLFPANLFRRRRHSAIRGRNHWLGDGALRTVPLLRGGELFLLVGATALRHGTAHRVRPAVQDWSSEASAGPWLLETGPKPKLECGTLRCGISPSLKLCGRAYNNRNRPIEFSHCILNYTEPEP